MAVPQYQVSSSSNAGRKGTLLRIRPTLQENLRFPCGTVITVPYIGESQVLAVTAYYGQPFQHAEARTIWSGPFPILTERQKTPGAGAELIADVAQAQAGAGIHPQVEALEIPRLAAVGVAPVLHAVQGV